MGKYFRTLFISFSLAYLFFIGNVDALSWSNVLVRTAYFYENGTLVDSGFVSTNPRNLPQYTSNAMGAVSMRLFQWRYSTSTPLEKGRYKISTDITFSSLTGNDIVNFLNPKFDGFGCGSSLSNSSSSNCTLVDYNTIELSSNKFQFNYTVDLLNDNCSFFDGIFNYYGNEYNNFTIVNLYGTENETLSYYSSYQRIQSNEDIIDSANKNTEDIINNQDKNTQDIIDNQDKNTQDIINNQNELLSDCRSSYNLFDLSSISSITNGIINSDNTITSNINNSYYIELRTTSLNSLFTNNIGGTYTFSYVPTVEGKYGSIVIVGTDVDGNTKYQDIYLENTNKITFTISTNFIKITNLYIRLNRSFTAFTDTTTVFSNFMLNEGAIPIKYEPYGEKICESKIDGVQDSIDDLTGAITDDSPPDTSGLADAAGWLPAGPIDSIVTLPINLLQSLTNNLESSCTPINLPIPYIDSNLTLACPATLLKKFDGFWMFWESFGLIAGVWCLYKYFINLYKWVESHLSMDEKESLGKWGGV